MSGGIQKTASNIIFGPTGKEVLLILEGEGATNAGLYSLPGGRCQAGESPPECAVREAMEEASVAIRVVRETGNFVSDVKGTLYHGFVFESEIVSGNPAPSGGTLAVAWATLLHIRELEKRDLMIKGRLCEAIKDSLDGKCVQAAY